MCIIHLLLLRHRRCQRSLNIGQFIFRFVQSFLFVVRTFKKKSTKRWVCTAKSAESWKHLAVGGAGGANSLLYSLVSVVIAVVLMITQYWLQRSMETRETSSSEREKEPLIRFCAVAFFFTTRQLLYFFILLISTMMIQPQSSILNSTHTHTAAYNINWKRRRGYQQSLSL